MEIKLFLKNKDKEIAFLKDITLPFPPAEKAIVFIARDQCFTVDSVIWHLDGDVPVVTVILR